MHLTVHTDYALRVLTYLALNGSELATINDIADFYGISKNHLVKVVHRLSQDGVIEAIRGRAGGIRLARSPEEVNIGKVVRKTEPGFHMVNCHTDDGDCRVIEVCGLPEVFAKATRAFLAELDKVTLADVISKKVLLKDLA